jgi:hypothetical protein
MRILKIMLLSVALCGCTLQPAVPVSEKGRLAEAELLVRYSLTDRIIDNAVEDYVKLFSGYLISRQVPGKQVEAMIQEEVAAMMEDDQQRLLDALVPIYRRYYTADEIHQLLTFYRTEVARKSIEVSAQIAAEAQEPLRSWNEHYVYLLLDRLEARMTEMGLKLKQ